MCDGGRFEQLTLLSSARLSTLSTTSSGCFFHGEDMTVPYPLLPDSGSLGSLSVDEVR